MPKLFCPFRSSAPNRGPEFTSHEVRVEVGDVEVVDVDQAICDANRVDRDGAAL
jgi:hypothetical protein